MAVRLELLVPLKEVPGNENISQFRAGGSEVYAYDEIKEFINQLPPLDGNITYGFADVSPKNKAIHYKIIIAAGILVIGGGAVAAAVFRKRQMKRRDAA